MIGKFENEEALLKSYGDLEKEFTKKCQELSRIKKELEETKLSMISDDVGGEVVGDINADQVVESEDEAVSENIVEEVLDSVCETTPVAEEVDKNDESAVIFEDKKPESIIDLGFRAKANEFLLNNSDAKIYSKEIAKILMKDKSLLSLSDPFGVAYALVLKEKRNVKFGDNESDVVNEKNETKIVQEIKNEQPRVNLLGKNIATFSPVRMVQKFKSIDDAREELIRRFS